jgi:prevent-host-death family protein
MIGVRFSSIPYHTGVAVPEAPTPLRLEAVATGSYILAMNDMPPKSAPAKTTVSMKEAKNRLTELARRVEAGETVTITRNGKPVLDMVPHKTKGGLNLEFIEEFKKKHGVTQIFTYVADDFDDPLPEDFLLRPLP